MPETTGDTENGRSISVVEERLAPELELGDRTTPPQTPNTRLSGTAITATSSVSRIAALRLRSLKAAKKTSAPLRKASTNTSTSGSTSTSDA